MAQNKSHAVMAQRHEPPDSLDFFPTPPWATRALFHHVLRGIRRPNDLLVWEPACGEGHMAEPLKEFFGEVFASDVFDYGYGQPFDFLSLGDGFAVPLPLLDKGRKADWIVTNPPFGPAGNPRFQRFALLALELAREGIAMFGRIQALAGADRYRKLYVPYRGRYTWAQFVERVPIIKGRLDGTASTATDYGWLVIRKDEGLTPIEPFVHIPPCRRRLERPEDYEVRR